MSAAGRVALLVLAAVSLLTGVGGGLARLGVPLPVGAAAGYHGALMICGFLGTVISLERAVALGHPLAFAAPVASGIGAVLYLAGVPLAPAFWIAAPLLLMGASAAIVRRQPLLHTVLLLVAAAAWLVANALFVTGHGPDGVALWGFLFLVLTIAAERLEMARLMRPRPLARPTFHAATALLLAGGAIAIFRAEAGMRVFGLGLVALAAWLAHFDLARRTVHTEGFARYSAVALLTGYAWLAIAGLAWGFLPQMPLLRDTALHALGLGFVFSMIFAHAPIVVPVVAKVRMRYTPAFYAPLALLHLSLAARLLAGFLEPSWRAAASAVNAFAILAFAALLLANKRVRPQGSGGAEAASMKPGV